MADLVITATVVDGSGAASVPGWVAITGDRIERVGTPDEPAPSAPRTLERPTAVVAPGFVDVHSHADLSAFEIPEMSSSLRQGVTTVVVGNCGSSPWPLAGWDEGVGLAYGSGRPAPSWTDWRDYLDALEAARPAVNIATLVGHGSVRLDVMGLERRAPSGLELDRMRAIVRDAVADGAFGLSTGLIYVPGLFSDTAEVIALAAAAGSAGGIYASHVRGEGRDLFRAVREAIEIGRRGELPAHVSHLKCESERVWGRASELLALVHGADDATGDQYPYEAWNSSLASLLPPWAPVADLDAVAARDRSSLRDAVEIGEDGFQSSIDGVGWERIVLETAPEPAWRGSSVADVAERLGVEPFDAFLELLRRDPDVSCIGHAMSPADVRTILRDPAVFVASDASPTAPDGLGADLPVHPRGYGTFPRALALARDEDLLPLEAVVRKMTSLPADRFGLRDRGRVRAGAFADLVVFDAAAIRDTASYERPHSYPVGMHEVLVNGTVAWSSSSATPIERAGRALRR